METYGLVQLDWERDVNTINISTACLSNGLFFHNDFLTTTQWTETVTFKLL